MYPDVISQSSVITFNILSASVSNLLEIAVLYYKFDT